jgi:transaldolase
MVYASGTEARDGRMGSEAMGGVAETSLRLFLDTADTAAWDMWLPTGLFHGITTNPTILAASGIPSTLSALNGVAIDAFSRGVAELQMQTFGRDADRLAETGRAIAALDPRIVVKVPITQDGVVAAHRLKAEGIRVTLTAVYAAHQAVTAAAIGADYVAPYLGRMADAGRDAFGEIAAMQEIAARSGGAMRVLVASVRSADDLARLGRLGVDTFTFGPRIAAALFADPLTNAAAEAFEKAAEAG